MKEAIFRIKQSPPFRFAADLAAAIDRGDLMALAAEMAFGLVLAVFPALLIFVTFLGIVQTPYNVKYIADLSGALLPEEIYSPIDPAITQLVYGLHEGSILTLSIITGIWSLASVFITILKAQERLFGHRSIRFHRKALRGLVLTIAMSAVLFAAFNLLYYIILYQYLTISRYGLWWLSPWVLRARFPAAFMIAFIFFLIVYRFTTPERITVRQVLPGSVFAAISWILLTISFRYILRFQTPDGSLRIPYQFVAKITTMMLWMYMNSLLFLVGAAWNRLMVKDNRR